MKQIPTILILQFFRWFEKTAILEGKVYGLLNRKTLFIWSAASGSCLNCLEISESPPGMAESNLSCNFLSAGLGLVATIHVDPSTVNVFRSDDDALTSVSQINMAQIMGSPVKVQTQRRKSLSTKLVARELTLGRVSSTQGLAISSLKIMCVCNKTTYSRLDKLSPEPQMMQPYPRKLYRSPLGHFLLRISSDPRLIAPNFNFQVCDVFFNTNCFMVRTANSAIPQFHLSIFPLPIKVRLAVSLEFEP